MCISPIWIEETTDTQGTYVPCGRCYECIETKRRVWTLRLIMELRVAESAYFLTLTYEPENVPLVLQWNMHYAMTLQKKDIQDFNKRLRQNIMQEDTRYLKQSEKTGNWSPKYRYFACGEYGPKTERPHYHIIAYNIPHDYFIWDPIHEKYYSKILEEIWGKGRIEVGEITHGRAHYVTKHHMFPLDELFNRLGSREKPFALMSTKPGLGLNYIDDKLTDYFTRTKNSFATLKNGNRSPLGRYYKEKIKEAIDDPEAIREASRKAKEYAENQKQQEREAYESEADFIEAKRQEFTAGYKRYKRNLIKNSKL